jgi:polysaccharide transporter, PST family
MKIESKTLKYNTIMLYILQISKYVFPLITFPYLTRVLQPENFGIITFVNSVMVYFQLLIDYGFLQSATKECSLYRSDKDKLSQVLVSTVQVRSFLAILGLIIILLMISFSDTFKGRETYILLAYIPIVLGVLNFDYLFRGLEIMNIITYRTIVGRVIYTLLLFIFIQKSDHYLLIPIIASVGEIFILIWTWFYISKNIGISLKFISSFKGTINAFKESSMFFLSRIATTAYSSTNIVILGFLYDNSSIAQFGVANTLIINIRSLFSPIADSLYPYMIRNKDFTLVKKILFVLMPIILVGTVILFFLAEPIVLLMAGENYLDAVVIFRALLPIVLITLPVYLLGFPVLGAMNRMRDANLSVIFASVYHLMGLSVLFYYGNINFINVAFLTFSTELIVLIYRLICIRR